MTAAAMKALDLFCSAGGATRGLMQAGFAVTGVDLRPQPRYCGTAFFQADALEYLTTADMSRFGGDDGTGDYIPKPKWMRWPTYNRKLEEVAAAEEVVDGHTLAFVQILGRRLGR
jgi:hypothetical protein